MVFEVLFFVFVFFFFKKGMRGAERGRGRGFLQSILKDLVMEREAVMMAISAC